MQEGKILYEIGYKLVPTIVDEEVTALVSEIVGKIEALGGVISYSEMPKLRDLEYVISKSIDRKRSDFSQGYFGWIRFEIEPAELNKLQKELSAHASVIRFIVLREPESMLLPVSQRAPRARRAPRDEKAPTEEASKEMEKEIDALIASTEEVK